MKTINIIATVAMALLLVGQSAKAASSTPVAINTSPMRNGHWSRVCTNAVPLAWEWRDASAVRAELILDGLRGTQAVTFTRPTTNWVWQVSATPALAEEDVVELTMTFYDSQDAVTSVLISRLSVVSGAYGGTPVLLSDAGKRWTHVREAAVIPYDACWTNANAQALNSRLSIRRQDGAAQTNLLPAAGYYGWKLRGSPWGYGTFNLELDFPENAGLWEAALIRIPEGGMIKVQ